MSADRVDQAAYAADLLERQSHWPADRDGNDPESDRVIQEALVRATLALVEQQRIATISSLTGQGLINPDDQVRAEILNALGLS